MRARHNVLTLVTHCLLPAIAFGFAPPLARVGSVSCFSLRTASPYRATPCASKKRPQVHGLRMVDTPAVIVAKDEGSVGVTLCAILQAQALQAIEEKGSFYFAISGGSMLSMLSYLAVNPAVQTQVVDWSRCTMGFVSHRAVPLDDDGATFHKARPVFLQSWMDQGLKVITPTGSPDAQKEADAYEAALKAAGLPFNDAGLAVFDLLLIGVGTDGHVGSIYPNLPDVESSRTVLAATSGTGKISMSLAAMQAATTSVVACAGKSQKAPLGKAEAMVRALESETETPMSFPASALRRCATWLICQVLAPTPKP
jgi:6-phosphogluconolactonase